MTYVQLAKSLRIRRNMKLILLKNQERIKKLPLVMVAIESTDEAWDLGWDLN
jgi:hypothetical protein